MVEGDRTGPNLKVANTVKQGTANGKSDGTMEMPRDGKAVMKILESMGVEEYEPRVIHQVSWTKNPVIVSSFCRGIICVTKLCVPKQRPVVVFLDKHLEQESNIVVLVAKNSICQKNPYFPNRTVAGKESLENRCTPSHLQNSGDKRFINNNTPLDNIDDCYPPDCENRWSQLLEFLQRYIYDVLTEARVYSEHASKTAVDLDDVRLAVQAKVNFSFTQPPPREVSTFSPSQRLSIIL